MKTKLSILLLFAALISSCGNKTKTGDATATGDAKAAAPSEQKAPADKKLPFERGSYVQETNMMGMNTKNTVWFDKWGDWTATEHKT